MLLTRESSVRWCVPDRLRDLRLSSAAASRAFRCSMLPFLAPIDDLRARNGLSGSALPDPTPAARKTHSCNTAEQKVVQVVQIPPSSAMRHNRPDVAACSGASTDADASTELRRCADELVEPLEAVAAGRLSQEAPVRARRGRAPGKTRR